MDLVEVSWDGFWKTEFEDLFRRSFDMQSKEVGWVLEASDDCAHALQLGRELESLYDADRSAGGGRVIGSCVVFREGVLLIGGMILNERRRLDDCENEFIVFVHITFDKRPFCGFEHFDFKRIADEFSLDASETVTAGHAFFEDDVRVAGESERVALAVLLRILWLSRRFVQSKKINVFFEFSESHT